MHLQRISVYGMLLFLLIAPLVAVAQDVPDGPRGDIQIFNDGKKPARITLWTNGGGDPGSQRWTFPPGQGEFLENGTRRIKVRGSDQISLGQRAPIDIGQVAQLQGGSWYVSVRALRRATQPRRGLPSDHERAYPPGRGRGVPPDQEPAYPPEPGTGVPPGAPAERQRY
jgi:hypothetical protein